MQYFEQGYGEDLPLFDTDDIEGRIPEFGESSDTLGESSDSNETIIGKSNKTRVLKFNSKWRSKPLFIPIAVYVPKPDSTKLGTRLFSNMYLDSGGSIPVDCIS